MRRRLTVRAAELLLVALVLFLLAVRPAWGAPSRDQNVGGGGGGYDQLPACASYFYGVTLYVLGHGWLCVHASPDHWVIVS